MRLWHVGGAVQHSITVHLPPSSQASIPHRGNGQDKPYFTSFPEQPWTTLRYAALQATSGLLTDPVSVKFGNHRAAKRTPGTPKYTAQLRFDFRVSCLHRVVRIIGDLYIPKSILYLHVAFLVMPYATHNSFGEDIHAQKHGSHLTYGTIKGKEISLQAWTGPVVSRQSAHEGGKAVSPLHRPSPPPTPQGNIPGTHFC